MLLRQAAARIPADERIFRAGRRARTLPRRRSCGSSCNLPAFEHAYYEATRALRSASSGMRDPKRRLHWNRVVLFRRTRRSCSRRVSHERRSWPRRLAPADAKSRPREGRWLRLNRARQGGSRRSPAVLDRGDHLRHHRLEHGDRLPAQHPRRSPLKPRSDYERKHRGSRAQPPARVPLRDHPHAHRERARHLVPHGRESSVSDADPERRRPSKSASLDSWAKAPIARNVVEGRPFGMQRPARWCSASSALPPRRCPRACERVIILSDPTHRHGLALGRTRMRTRRRRHRPRGEARSLPGRVDPGLEWRPHRHGERHREPRCHGPCRAADRARSPRRAA